MKATMLLCDAAQEVGGKLYILGAGWSVIWFPNTPINMALAIKVEVPWDQTNRSIPVRAALMTDDGEEVDLGEGPVLAGGEVTVGRPPHIKPGTAIDLPFVMAFNGVALDAGGYRWELTIDQEMVATTAFRVMSGLPGQPQQQGGES